MKGLPNLHVQVRKSKFNEEPFSIWIGDFKPETTKCPNSTDENDTKSKILAEKLSNFLKGRPWNKNTEVFVSVSISKSEFPEDLLSLPEFEIQLEEFLNSHWIV